jgi:hypothetical protein
MSFSEKRKPFEKEEVFLGKEKIIMLICHFV